MAEQPLLTLAQSCKMPILLRLVSPDLELVVTSPQFLLPASLNQIKNYERHGTSSCRNAFAPNSLRSQFEPLLSVLLGICSSRCGSAVPAFRCCISSKLGYGIWHTTCSRDVKHAESFVSNALDTLHPDTHSWTHVPYFLSRSKTSSCRRIFGQRLQHSKDS